MGQSSTRKFGEHLLREKNKMDTPIYNLELHEAVSVIIDNTKQIDILRVPGGWIYNYKDGNDIFVPYNNEFIKEDK